MARNKHTECSQYYRAYYDEGTNELARRTLSQMRARCDGLYTPRIKFGFTFDDGCNWNEHESVEMILDSKAVDDLVDVLENYDQRAQKSIRKW